MAPIIFETAPYTRSHGAEPKGRGSWAFQIDSLPDLIWSPSMTYGDAKKWARTEARNIAPADAVQIIVRVQP